MEISFHDVFLNHPLNVALRRVECDGSVVVATRTTGQDEDGGEERQRHQRRPYPLRLCHRDDYTADLVFHFHNLVFLSTY
jgi:hypothetical protein